MSETWRQALTVVAAIAGTVAGVHTAPAPPSALSVANAVEVKLAPIVREVRELRKDVDQLKKEGSK